MAATIQVKGLRELQLSFKLMEKEVARDMRVTLKAAGEPVRS